MGEVARDPVRENEGRRPLLRVVRGVGEGERREGLTLSPPPPSSPQHHRAKRPLRASERALAAWLRRCLGTVAAEGMVRRFGVRAIVAAVTEQDIVVRDDLYGGRLVANAQLRSPGGFLRMVLTEQEASS